MAPTKIGRRSEMGGYARGERTRRRILAVAIGLFGESGFAATSTRQIAERSGTKAAAIQYYFGGQKSLYTAGFAFAHQGHRHGSLPGSSTR